MTPKLMLFEDLSHPRSKLLEELSLQLDRRITAQDLEQGPYGKLEVKGSRLHFNTSHSHRWTVFAFGDQPLGIDIEFKSPRPNARKVLKRFFPAEIGENFDSLREPLAENDYFFKVWTFYESITKLYGGSAFHFHRADALRSLEPDTSSLQSPNLFVQKVILPDSELACAVASHRPWQIPPLIRGLA